MIESTSLPGAPQLQEAEAILVELAALFAAPGDRQWQRRIIEQPANAETRYRTLVEQLPAIVFLVHLDRPVGEAYVSPQIEALVGFSREEWLENPVRWFNHIHPEDKNRWSVEAADMFLTGKPLRSVYRVLARDGRTVWFHCDAKMVRHEDGRPWFIHGVAFDITELKRAEEALQEERNFISAVLDTVGALVVVLNPEGNIERLNRACERTMGYCSDEIRGRKVWDVFLPPREAGSFRAVIENARGEGSPVFESRWLTRDGDSRVIVWESKHLRQSGSEPRSGASADYIIAAGIDITESKRLEQTILDISQREHRRIGEELHDGLGQHLTGIAFMSKVLHEKLEEKSLPEAADAATILQLVNEAIGKTRELSRGLLPVVSEPHGLMSALERWSCEVETLFRVRCAFECGEPVLVHEDAVANHLYLIAREAVMNGIRHGRAHSIEISLSVHNGSCVLSVQDDGVGLPEQPAKLPGLGLRIMNYRAKMVGGTLAVANCPEGGTAVTCVFPAEHIERRKQA